MLMNYKFVCVHNFNTNVVITFKYIYVIFMVYTVHLKNAFF